MGVCLVVALGTSFVANDVSRGTCTGVAPRSLPSLLKEVTHVDTSSLLDVSNSLSILVAHVEELS